MAKKRKKRGRYTDDKVVEAIQRHTRDGGLGPAAILRELEKEFPADRVPTRNTVRDISIEHKADTSAAWSLAAAQLDDVAVVLPFLAYRATRVLSYGDNREYAPAPVSKNKADWIVRIRRAAPDAPMATTWDLAQHYVSRTERTELTADLDLLLAFEVWNGNNLPTFKQALEDLKEPPQQERDVTWLIAEGAPQWKRIEGGGKPKAKESKSARAH